MVALRSLIDELWIWAGKSEKIWSDDALDFDPLTFPKFQEIRILCLELLNKPLDSEKTKYFLMCMALDNEEEHILDHCRDQGDPEFIIRLAAAGITFPKYEARWQIAELLRKDIPDKENYLQQLLNDDHPYVRKRAWNVISHR